MEQSHQSISRTVGQHLQPLPMYPSIAQRDHERLTLTERDVTNKQHPKSWKVTSCSTSCTKWKPRNDGGASGCAANCRTCGVRCAAAGADGGSGSDGMAKCVAAPAPAAATPGTARPCPRPAGDWSFNAGPGAAAGAPGGAGRGMAEAAGDRVAEKCASTPRRGGGSGEIAR